MVLADQPLAIWQINALGTAHVLEAARLHKVARVVVCSTCDVYGDLPGDVDETTLPRPVSVYGASKVAAEAAMQAYIREHGLDAVALRLGWIYGPGRQTPTTLEDMIRASLAGRPLTVAASPEQVTHYLYVDDAVQGLLCAGQVAALPGRVYNISAGQGVAMGDVVKVFAKVAPTCEVTLSGGKASPVPASLDNRRAARDLGFAPATSLEQGLLLDQYRSICDLDQDNLVSPADTNLSCSSFTNFLMSPLASHQPKPNSAFMALA
jgi:nucleoside-diphosphate-sugar epimerase